MDERRDSKAWMYYLSTHFLSREEFRKACDSTREGKKYSFTLSSMGMTMEKGDEIYINNLISSDDSPHGVYGHGIVSWYNGSDITVEFDRILNVNREKILMENLPEFWDYVDSNPRSTNKVRAIRSDALKIINEEWEKTIKWHDTFGIIEMASFLRNYGGESYISPDKAGDSANKMKEIKQRGDDARQIFISFGKEFIKDTPELEIVSCDNWLSDDQVVQDFFKIDIKSKKFKNSPEKISLLFQQSISDLYKCSFRLSTYLGHAERWSHQRPAPRYYICC